MENRFGIKDFVLLLLVCVLIAMVWLAMVQYDRQWDLMRQTNNLLVEQTTDISHIRRLLEQGAGAGLATTNPSVGQAYMAGFEHVTASHSQPDYAEGDDLIDTFLATPTKLTPVIATDLGAIEVQGAVFDTLATQDSRTLKWIPRLAQSWKVSDDQLTIDFELRRGITFSDGSPLTADDVVFTFDFMRDPAIEDPEEKAYVDRLKKVEKVGDYEVRFIFGEPYFKSFETAALTPILSKAFYSKFSATDFNRSTGLVMGSGPYRLPDPESWRPQPGRPVVLVRNERYWGPTPAFNRLIWNVIENPMARTTAFRNGDTDLYGGQNGPPTPEQYDQMLKDKDLLARTQHWALESPTQGFFYIGWNEKQGRMGAPTPFADARVRKALTMLTDRDAIVRDIMRGYATVISGPFSTLLPQSDPSIKPWPYDPDGAMKLLAEAGFTRQGDRLICPDGQPFQFKLMFNNSSEIRRRIASYVRDAYAKAGILVDPEPTEWSVFIKRMDDRQFDAMIGGWAGTIEFDAYQIFHSSQMDGIGDDFVQFKDVNLDHAIEKARATVDDDKRALLWHDVHRLLHEDQPYTFLFIDKELDFLTNRIHGVEPTKLGLNPSEEWYVPLAIQKYHD
jgi:peptide/nickel transport system substrate-binding protein